MKILSNFVAFLENTNFNRNYWSQSNLIMVRNLNSGLSCLITTVRLFLWKKCKCKCKPPCVEILCVKGPCVKSHSISLCNKVPASKFCGTMAICVKRPSPVHSICAYLSFCPKLYIPSTYYKHLKIAAQHNHLGK